MARKKDETEENTTTEDETSSDGEELTEKQDETVTSTDDEGADEHVPEAEEDTAESDPQEAVVEEETAGAPADDPASATSGVDATAPVVLRKGGFMPMVLGGVVAAGIGAAAVIYLLPELPESWLPQDDGEIQALTEQVETQSTRIAELQEAQAEQGDTSQIETALNQAQASLDGVNAEIGDIRESLGRLDGIDERLTTLEKAPVADATPEAVEAYRRELEALQEALAKQRAEVEAMAQAAEEERASAEMTAQDALKRSALSQILTSLETGSAYAEAISRLEEVGIEIPDPLRAEADGVVTVSELSEAFPPVAREALAAARGESEGGGLGNFLKNQLGARSLEPREGDDPDAVLSRMEAAAREGRFGDVEAEADALPEAAQAPLEDWLEAARARRAAVEAAEALNQQVNSN